MKNFELIIVFVASIIFGFIYYIEQHITEVAKKNNTKMYIRGILNSFIGALFGITIYQLLEEYMQQWGMNTKMIVSIIGAVFHHLIIIYTRNYVLKNKNGGV